MSNKINSPKSRPWLVFLLGSVNACSDPVFFHTADDHGALEHRATVQLQRGGTFAPYEGVLNQAVYVRDAAGYRVLIGQDVDLCARLQHDDTAALPMPVAVLQTPTPNLGEFSLGSGQLRRVPVQNLKLALMPAAQARLHVSSQSRAAAPLAFDAHAEHGGTFSLEQMRNHAGQEDVLWVHVRMRLDAGEAAHLGAHAGQALRQDDLIEIGLEAHPCTSSTTRQLSVCLQAGSCQPLGLRP